MNRQQFSSRNNIGKVFTFQKSGSTSSFDPFISFSPNRRVSWRLDNGLQAEQIAGNSLVYTGFTSDTSIRTIEMRGGNFRGINELLINDDNIYGYIDLSIFNNCFEGSFTKSINFSNNICVTGITNPITNLGFTSYALFGCDITNDLNLTPISGDIASFSIQNNPNLTSLTFSNNTKITSSFNASSCNLIGGLNANFFSGISFQVQQNSSLTGITHIPINQNVTQYNASFCNLTNVLDLTPITGLGGSFQIQNNPNLTGLNHVHSSNVINNYIASSCNLTNELDLTFFPNLGGIFNVSSNLNLTGITHTASTRVFTNYTVSSCNLIGNHDVSMLSNLGGELRFSSNPLLTGITFTTASTRGVSFFIANSCDIQGGLDLSPFSGFGSTLSGSASQIRISANSGLTSFIFPESNGLYYRNIINNSLNAAFGMHTCSLGYIDFKLLSGSTLISGVTAGIPRIELFGNGMTTAEVNHILSDFDTISSLNYSGWTSTSGTSGAYVDISGNSAPDGSSGGYNGTGATINLISKGWTIITD